jgi:type II secretory pathway pseudopilin PulG
MVRQSGLTILELLFTTALIATILTIALPILTDSVDAQRTVSAARYLAGRITLARFEAIKRSTSVGLKFEKAGNDYAFAAYVDGNGNGVRTLDIRIGTDTLLMDAERLSYNFTGVRFGLMPGVPDADGVADVAQGDGVRIGSARILTLGANGTATPGTLYLHGRRKQLAVRVLGVTGRTRVLRYDVKTRKWLGE